MPVDFNAIARSAPAGLRAAAETEARRDAQGPQAASAAQIDQVRRTLREALPNAGRRDPVTAAYAAALLAAELAGGRMSQTQAENLAAMMALAAGQDAPASPEERQATLAAYTDLFAGLHAGTLDLDSF